MSSKVLTPPPYIAQNAIYDPATVSTYAVQSIRRRQDEKRTVRLGIDGIDGYFAPLLAGDTLVVIAQSSHWKSSFLHMVERHAAYQFEQEERREVVVHVSVEELIEPQAYLYLAREAGLPVASILNGQVQDWSQLEAAAMRIGSIPIYRIGESLARSEDMPNLYLSNMVRSIEYLEQQILKPRKLSIGLLAWDYIQAFPFDPELRGGGDYSEQRRLQVRSDFFRIRQASARFQCPSIIGSQARDDLKGAPGPSMLIPGYRDSEESQSIGQRADRCIQLWMPKQTHMNGQELVHQKYRFTVIDEMLWLRVGKQRGGYPAGKIWECRIDFQNNELYVV